MKKLISITLAVIIALSCSAMAFAATNVCPYCGNTFSDEKAYNEHLAICYSQKGGNPSDTDYSNYADYDKFVKLDANGVLDKLIKIFSAEASWWNDVESIIIRIADFIENIAVGKTKEADVAGAVDDLEAKVADLPIVGDICTYIHNLITTLKQKIKDLYAGNKETTITETETTAAEAPADTGSASVGIIAFAAVSAAAAAAYVCIKKKA